MQPSNKDGRLLTNWRVGLFIILAVSIFIYIPTLTGGAIWDDTELISGSGFGKNTFLSAFTHPFLKIYFRPLTSASFVLDSSFAKATPFFYHQTNILLHAFTAVMLAYLALAVTKKELAGILAGVFFALQPVQVDATAWIGGRTDVLSAFFIVPMLVTLVRYHQTQKRPWLYLSAFLLLCAATSKEQAIALLPAVPLSVFVFGKKTWADVRKVCIPFVAVTLIFIGLWAIDAPFPVGAHNGLASTVKVGLKTTALYTQAFFVPSQRSLITWTLENYRGMTWLLAGVAAIVAAGFTLKWLWGRSRPIAWVAICGLLVYLPISNFPNVPTIVVAPYRCAEAGTMVACLLGMGLAWAIVNKKALLAIPLAANLILGAIVTNQGIHVWTSEFHFFDVAAHNDPHFIAGVTHYAEGLNAENRWKEAYAWTDELLTWSFGTKDWAKRIETKGASALDADVKERVHTNIGNPEPKTLGYIVSLAGSSLISLQKKEEGIKLYQDALLISPKDPRVNFAYGHLIIGRDRAEAIRHWELALKVSPKFPACAAALAHERIIDGRFQDAVNLLEPSMETVGWNCDAWIDLADAKIGLKDYAGASAALDSAGKALLVIKPKIDQRRRLIQILTRDRGQL